MYKIQAKHLMYKVLLIFHGNNTTDVFCLNVHKCIYMLNVSIHLHQIITETGYE